MNLLLLLFAPVIRQLNNIQNTVTSIEQKVTQMAAVQIDQSDLDAFAADISESVDAVAAEIQRLVDDPGNPLVAADVTALTAAVDKLKGLEPPAVEPVPDQPHPDQTLPGDLPAE